MDQQQVKQILESKEVKKMALNQHFLKFLAY